MKVKVLLFGQLTEITASQELWVDGVYSSDELIEQLVEQYPMLASSKYALAVNKMIVNQDTALTKHCTVALLPPFSGG